jgi:uncharacterized protein (DUF58 family)
MKFSTASRGLFGFMILIGLVGWTVTGLSIYARLVYLGLLLVIGSLIWAILSLRGITFQRRTRSLKASMGEVLEETMEVKNSAWPGAAWLEVLNKSDLPGAAGSRLFTRVGVRQKRFYAARTPLTKRGSYLLGPTLITSGDPFGLFTTHKQIPASDTLIVFPKVFPIAIFPPPPGLLPGGKTIRLRSYDVTPHASGVREYVVGDPVKLIHWPSTAHRERFMVKEFEQDPQSDIWLFLDAEKSVHAALPDDDNNPSIKAEGWWLRRPTISLPRDTFEYAASAAASLASFFLGERRAVGLACAAGKLAVASAERGVRQLNKMMEMLAVLQPEGEIPLYGLVDIQSKLLPLGSGVILITSSIRPELILAVENLQRRNLRPAVVLIKPETFGSQSQSAPLVAGLLKTNIPLAQVGCGDNLSVQLALPGIYFLHHYVFSSSYGGRG